MIPIKDKNYSYWTVRLEIICEQRELVDFNCNTWNHYASKWTLVCLKITSKLFVNKNIFHAYMLSSSSCHTARTDLLDALTPLVPLVYRSREVLQAISSIGTELLYIGSRWSTYFARLCEGVHWSI